MLKKKKMNKFLLPLIVLFVFQSSFGQNDITIYWDASYSMKDRQIDKEFNYLNNYFNKFTNQNVQLVTFSNDIILEQKFEIQNSDWGALKTELQNTVYDGATSYSGLFKDESNAYLLFTDGQENLDKLEPVVEKPIHIISTSISNNAPRYNRIADASGGSYVVLSHEIDKIQVSDKAMVFDSAEDGLITGVITNNGLEAIPLVNIINKRTNKAATSSSDGSYSIEAEIGDVLVFTHLGKRTVNIKVVYDQMNISMTDINQQLEEVVVAIEVEKEDLVNVGNSAVNKKKIGYSVESIDEGDISAIDTDVQQAVKGQFAGLQLANDTAIDNVDLSQFIGRGRNSTIALSQYGLVVVDGVPQQQSNSAANGAFSSSTAGTINPDAIASITYLKGLAATNKYGTLGKNGVLLITTKASILGKAKKNRKIKLGTTDTYTETAQLIASLPNSPYIKALRSAKSVNEAFEVYLEQRTQHGDKAEFFIDSHDYFQGWNNPYLSDRILSNVYEVFFDNAEILRVLAYKQTEKNKSSEALLTYRQVLKLRPNEAQSYLDLARAESLAGNYQEAFKIYDRIDKMRNVGRANFSGVEKTVSNEFKNLINFHKNELNTSGVNPKYLNSIKHKARIVFEWNNLDSEFDLQIVNPQKRFFNWEHSKSKAAQRIAEEKQQGYGLEEFYLTSSDVGEWLFNLKYFGSGKNDGIPSYLKVSIYKDFGHPNETKETKVIRLSEKGKLQTAVKLKI
jgi:tetratricopeptide (TPR) repeat protein